MKKKPKKSPKIINRKKLREIKKYIFIVLLGFAAYAIHLTVLTEKDMPPLQDGDLIFQTSLTDQSMAILLATGSIYIHTGIIKKVPQGYNVIEAGRTVRETPLSTWISRGIYKRFAVYRYNGITLKQGAAVVQAAKKYYGKRYDFYFSFDNDTIYCSELNYLAFRDAGIPLGMPVKIGSLYINNRFVKEIIEQRWHNYPACQGKGLNFEQCYDIMMNQQLVSPMDIANDSHLQRIFTNYP